MRTRYSRAVWAGFELVFRPWMSRRLDGIHIRGTEQTRWLPDLPILFVANHTSWWDGFLLREVHRRIRPEAPFHVVMTEKELRRIRLFQWMGAVPLPAGAFGGRALLRDLQERLEQRSDAVIAFFPQGRIWPAGRRPLGFQPGGAWLASHLAPIAVVPVGLHMEHLTAPGPAAFVSVGPPTVVRRSIESAQLEAMVTAETDGILAATRRFGEDAADRWDDGAVLGSPARLRVRGTGS